MKLTVQDIARQINGKTVGDGSLEVCGISSYEHPLPGTITFIINPKDLPAVEKSAVSCIIVPKTVQQSAKPLIQCENPKLAFAAAIAVFHPSRQYNTQVSPLASVAPSAKIGKNVTIEPFAAIGNKSEIKDGAVIRSFVFIDESVTIGRESIIHPHVTVYASCLIGERVTLHANCVIGSDGFGYVFDGRKQHKVPQVGRVVIENDVEIGSGTTIDRAAVGETVIGEGTKIDNQVQIAHNVVIGKHCAISAQCGISGSSKIGNGVIMGGSVGLADHVEIGDFVMLGANAGVPPGKKIPPKQIWFGQPARPYEEMKKQIGAQLRAAENQEELRALKKKMADLEAEIESLKSGSKS